LRATKLPEHLADWLGLESGDPSRERSSHPIGSLLPADLDDPSRVAEVSVAHVDRARRAEVAKLGISPKPFWPDGKPYAVCVTHDIDRVLATYQRLRGLRRAPLRSLGQTARDFYTAMHPSSRDENVFFNFSRIRRWEQERGIHSAFYVLFEKRRFFKALASGQIQHALGVYKPASIAGDLRALREAGCEIGLHCSFDSWSEESALKQELAELRELGLGDATGARTHYLCFDPARTPVIQARAGLSYDSSVGFNFLAGFSAGTSFPFRLGGIWELPLLLMDTALRHLSNRPQERRAIALRVRDEVRSHGGVLTLNWHSHLLHPDAQPEMVALLDEIISDAKRDGAWMALPREVVRWWQGRIV
jgi:hypothetical protein